MSAAAKANKGKKDTKKDSKKDPKKDSKKNAKDTKKDPKKDVKKAGNKGGAKDTKKDIKKDVKKDTKNTKKGTKDTKGNNKKNTKDTKKNGSKNTKDTKTTKAASGAGAGSSKPAAPLEVDIGPPVILPEAKEFETEIPAMKEFELKEDEIVDSLRTQFEELEKLLKDRKKACLTHARTLIASDTEDTPPVCIDIESMKRLIKNIGTKSGEKDYDRRVGRIRSLDKIKELIAYEAKHAAVTKKREQTSAENIEKEIAEGEKVLAEAEPHLQRARDLLKTINKSSLDEIRALPKPHALLVKTVQACAVMVGKAESELNGWANVKKLLKTTFINSLIEFEARNITKETREILETKYLGINNDDIPANEKLTFENVNKANAVAGNLVSWIEAQLKYNEFIPKVEPMQARLKELAVQLASIEGIVNKYDNALAELDKRIAAAKQEMRDNGKAFDAAAKACDP